MVTYRPILLAKRGELSALGMLTAAQWSSLTPVFQVAPRDWNFENSTYEKTAEQHLAELPAKLAKATKRHPAYIDVSLLDNVLPVFGGHHPLTWLIEEAATLGLQLAPFVDGESDPTTIAAASDAHARLGRPVGLRLPTNDWVTVDPTRLPLLLSSLSVAASDVDLFVDAEREFGTLTRAGATAEIIAQEAMYAFRSRTLGGSAFPVTQGLAKGLSEFDRSDWLLFRAVYRGRSAASLSGIDFFDYAVNNPAADVGLVDPRILSISALFRYATDEQWLVAKGDLFKGNAGRGMGARAMVAPLALLTAHSKYGVPLRTASDGWIDAVAAGTQNGGNPEAWRKWATLRHVLVVGHQLASPI